MKPDNFLVHPCRGVLHTPRKVSRRRFGSKIGRVLGVSLFGMGEIGCVFGVSVCGNMKPGGFCTYTCRGVLHTPRNVLRRRFGPKTGRVFGVSVCGNMKPGGFLAYPYWENVKPDRFFTYPCRGVLHTPRNVLRRRFRPKTGRGLGVSLLERVKSGAFLAGTCFGRRGGSGVLTPINGDRQNASQIRPIFAASN